MADIGAILNELGTRIRKLESRERGGVWPVVSITTSQTLKAANQVVLANVAGGNRKLTLPPASSARYVIITTKKTDASANTVELDADGAETIDGVSTFTLTAQNEAVTIWCSGTAWYVIGKYL